jgi:hypothetical protein
LLAGLTAAFAGCEARSAEQPADVHPQRLSRERSDLDNVKLTCAAKKLVRLGRRRSRRQVKRVVREALIIFCLVL